MDSPDTDLDLLSGDDKIIAEAKARFERCQKWYATERVRHLNDDKFANADSDNNYQWPDDLQAARIDNDRPIITINKTQQHNLKIINDAKKNKTSPKISPAGGGASYEAAQVMEGLLRHVEYISGAQDVYGHAITKQVNAGKGWWRITTAYPDEDSFDQEIYIRRIRDSLAIYYDPDCTEIDKSDRRFLLMFEYVPREKFKIDYPELKNNMPTTALDGSDTWLTDNHVRVAEYWRIKETKDKLLAIKQDDGSTTSVRKSKLSKELIDRLSDDSIINEREIEIKEVQWFKIAGNKIIDRRVKEKAWAGKYIPFICIVGQETIIDGIYDCRGHTRAQKDAQRMYNYNASASIEYGALQTKIPFIAPAEAVESNIDDWRNANTKNLAVLTYNHRDDDGGEIPAPVRPAPPQSAPLYLEAMQQADQQMMFVTGQYETAMGQYKPEASGKAINERQRQGMTATYHFDDNQAIGMALTAKMIIDLAPKIFDTKRMMKIMAEDGTETEVHIDPDSKKAHQIQKMQEGERIIFNPNLGKYDVIAQVGPSYATGREEAWNAITQILASNETLTPVIGDLLFKNADFPGADEIAERLERMVPPQAKGEGMPPAMVEMQKQIGNMQGILQKTMEELQSERLKMKGVELKLKGKDELRDIEIYKAITDRLDVIASKIGVTPKDKAVMLHDLMTEEHASGLRQVEAANAADLAASGEEAGTDQS